MVIRTRGTCHPRSHDGLRECKLLPQEAELLNVLGAAGTAEEDHGLPLPESAPTLHVSGMLHHGRPYVSSFRVVCQSYL